MDEKVLFRLVEKTSGPWHGKVWRCEEMTQATADAVNARITVMQWERCDSQSVSEIPTPTKKRSGR